MRLINVCIHLHEHIQTDLKQKPVLPPVKPQGLSVSIYTAEPTLVMASNVVTCTSNNGNQFRSLIVTFASAFKQKIMNNQAQTSLDATAAF